MVKPGNRQGKRLADMSATNVPTDDLMSTFDPDELDESTYDFSVGIDLRVIHSLVSWRNQLVHFAIMLEVMRDGHWLKVARADTCHAEAHLHRFVRGRHGEIDQARRQVFGPATTIEEINAGFDQAVDAMLDCEELLRRWESGN